MRGSSERRLAGLFAVALLVAARVHSQATEPPTRPKLPPPLVQQVEPETLKFTSPVLKRRFDTFLAQFNMRDERWQAEPLTLVEQSWQRGTFLYTATWRRDLKPDADWQPRVIPAMKPMREFSLQLTPVKGDRDTIQQIALRGTYVPPHNGWAASVMYQFSVSDDGQQETLQILFDHNQQVSNELPASKWDFLVPNNGIDARYRAKGSRIEFVARPLLERPEYHHQLLTAIATPDRLRDAELKLCDELEAKLRDDIKNGGVSYIDWTNVRSDNPPREIPLLFADAPDFTDDVKAAQLADGVARLDVRRSRWRDHADELHTAVREAFPLLVGWAAKRPQVEPNKD